MSITDTGGTRPWSEVKAAAEAARTPEQRAIHDAASVEADLALDMAELVYNARKAAGLSQTELARRMGTSQGVISQIEGGGQVPTVTTLARVARATGQNLQLNIPAVVEPAAS